MKSSRLRTRTLLLLLGEAMLLFGGVVIAVYVRLDAVEAENALIAHHGFYKAAIATVFCLTAFYFFDLYDFVVMRDRRGLVLRLLQALGLAWMALALMFYAMPQTMIGRGVTLISLPLALFLMVAWRLSIHWILGHPELGERILILGSGPFAVEIAKETLQRKDAGYRVIGFVDNDPSLVGKSLINPKVIGLTSEIMTLVRSQNIDRVVVAISDRRGQFPTQELLKLSLSGIVTQWNVTFYVHEHKTPASFTFKVEGTTVTGTAYSDHTGPGTIRDGKYAEGKLSFTLDFEKHESIVVTGALKDGKLSGDFSTEGFTDKWEATKK